jgi:hypothetical protein
MAKKSRATFQKRQKEVARQQRRQDKLEKRRARSAQKSNAPPRTGLVDPDLEGIHPGPQPLPAEWNYVPDRPRPKREPDEEGEKS